MTMNCLAKPTQQTGEPEAPVRASVPERFRRLKRNEVVWSDDFVAARRLRTGRLPLRRARNERGTCVTLRYERIRAHRAASRDYRRAYTCYAKKRSCH